jgi:hypothetical protein
MRMLPFPASPSELHEDRNIRAPATSSPGPDAPSDRPRKGAGSAGARGAVSRHGARARAELPAGHAYAASGGWQDETARLPAPAARPEHGQQPAAEEHEHPSMHAIESPTDRPARTGPSRAVEVAVGSGPGVSPQSGTGTLARRDLRFFAVASWLAGWPRARSVLYGRGRYEVSCDVTRSIPVAAFAAGC